MCGVGFCDCDCDCFITTAICKSFNKPDNCYELTIFRKFRDNWLKKQPDGESLINEYYNIAPIIVQKIDKSPNKDEIYFLIWEKWLKPCLNSIEEGMFDKCKFLYISMVNELRKIYV
jgi:hypothetical protein